MLDLAVIATFTAMWLVIVPTPGANSLMITHLAVSRPAADVAFALLGNLAGIALLAVTALLGWSALLALFPWAKLAVALLGAFYLVWFGGRLLRRGLLRGGSQGAAGADVAATAAGPARMVALGLATALSNAQAIIFITSIFAVAGVLGAPLATGIACILVMLTCNGLYLGLLAVLFQRPQVRALHARYTAPFEIIAGTLFVVFGGRLALSAFSDR